MYINQKHLNLATMYKNMHWTYAVFKAQENMIPSPIKYGIYRRCVAHLLSPSLAADLYVVKRYGPQKCHNIYEHFNWQ